jgi:hypothetical protein
MLEGQPHGQRIATCVAVVTVAYTAYSLQHVDALLDIGEGPMAYGWAGWAQLRRAEPTRIMEGVMGKLSM